MKEFIPKSKVAKGPVAFFKECLAEAYSRRAKERPDKAMNVDYTKLLTGLQANGSTTSMRHRADYRSIETVRCGLSEPSLHSDCSQQIWHRQPTHNWSNPTSQAGP